MLLAKIFYKKNIGSTQFWKSLGKIFQQLSEKRNLVLSNTIKLYNHEYIYAMQPELINETIEDNYIEKIIMTPYDSQLRVITDAL